MRLTPAENKEELHLSFYNDVGKLITEHIPKEDGALLLWFQRKYYLVMLRLNMSFYYWNVRQLLPIYERKTEDLRFINHVVTEHDTVPMSLRERWHFWQAWRLYGPEFELVTRTIFASYYEKKPFKHPYAIAYAKRWNLKRQAQWKTLYHGVDLQEYRAVLDYIIDRDSAEAPMPTAKN